MVNLDDASRDVVFRSASLASMRICLSPDGKFAATGTWNAKGPPYATVWDARTGVRVHDFDVPYRWNPIVAFSPDGKWLMTDFGQEAELWEVGTWKPRCVVKDAGFLHRPFSNDSSTLAVTSGSRRWDTRLIDPETAAELVTLDDLDEEYPLAFTPAGDGLATFRADGTIRLWNLRLIRHELADMGLDWPGPPLPPPTSVPRIRLSIATP